MAKNKKSIVHIGMRKMLCGISDKHAAHAVWSNSASVQFYEKHLLKQNERICHKCKYILKHQTPGAK